jgi:propanediol dehydratase small subunit
MIRKALRYLKIIVFITPISAFAMKCYWRRTCQGRAWKAEFPNEPAIEIRRFLKIFVQAFALPSSEYLQFNPNDRVLDVYRPLLNCMGADSLELEYLDEFIKHFYQLSLNQIWHPDLTLGQLYAATHPEKI